MDKHHILYNKQEWSLRPDAKALRETSILVPNLDEDIHKELHKNVPSVPLLGYHALRRVRRIFAPTDDVLESMDDLMRGIEYTATDPRAHEIEKHVGELAIWAIDLQRPYIRAGLMTDQLYFDLGA